MDIELVKRDVRIAVSVDQRKKLRQLTLAGFRSLDELGHFVIGAYPLNKLSARNESIPVGVQLVKGPPKFLRNTAVVVMIRVVIPVR